MLKTGINNNVNLIDFGLTNPLDKNIRGKRKMSEDKITGKPDYDVCTPIKSGKEDKTFWQKIGAAWKSDKGISLKLNALPLTSDIMLFEHKEKE